MSQSFNQSSQLSSHIEQTFSSSNSQEVYEATQFGSGVLKGYKRKEGEALESNGEMLHDGSNRQPNHGKFLKDTGIFGGITGDNNTLVEEDAQFDYKKHTVRDLVGHFSKVRPVSEIPVQYLPEQRMYNGEKGPSLNYLATKSESGSSSLSITKSSMSKQDMDTSRQEYEMRKKMQEQSETQATTKTTTTTLSSSEQNSVEMRSKTEMSEQQKKRMSERRQSLKDYLLMDPATTHANAGIIDPSAILRGENVTQWNPSDSSSSHASLRSTPSSNLYINKPSIPKPFGHSLPQSSIKTVPSRLSSVPPSQAINQQMSSSPKPIVPKIETEFVDIPTIIDASMPPVPQKNSPTHASLLSPDFQSEYQATVQTSTKHFQSASSSIPPQQPLEPDFQSSSLPPQSLESDFHSSSLLLRSVESDSHSYSLPPRPLEPLYQATGQLLTTTNTHTVQSQQNSVIHSSLKTLDLIVEDLQPAVSLTFPETSRSTASTPLPTNPFPPVDAPSCLSSLPPSLLLNRPLTPVLLSTRPHSSVEKRARHMSKDDIARMMAEINAPLPPMVPIPQDIRASPLLFCSRGAGTPSLASGSRT